MVCYNDQLNRTQFHIYTIPITSKSSRAFTPCEDKLWRVERTGNLQNKAINIINVAAKKNTWITWELDTFGNDLALSNRVAMM